MNVFQIMPAPKSKKAFFYDPTTKSVYSEVSDIIGIVEFLNPENSEEAIMLPVYLCTDKMGFYSVPQLLPNFLDVVDNELSFDIGKYTNQIQVITDIYKDVDTKLTEVETIQIQHEGKVSFIKRNLKKPLKQDDE